MPVNQRLGGSFAPPLTPKKLSAYRALAKAADPKLGEVLLGLCKLVETFQQTPASKLRGTAHPSGRGVIVPLEPAEIQRIWDHVPWDYEIDAYRKLFDQLPGDSPLRTPAFHLLWYATELEKDREPLTTDKL